MMEQCFCCPRGVRQSEPAQILGVGGISRREEYQGIVILPGPPQPPKRDSWPAPPRRLSSPPRSFMDLFLLAQSFGICSPPAWFYCGTIRLVWATSSTIDTTSFWAKMKPHCFTVVVPTRPVSPVCLRHPLSFSLYSSVLSLTLWRQHVYVIKNMGFRVKETRA